MLARTLGKTLHELTHTMTADEFGLWYQEFLKAPWASFNIDEAQEETQIKTPKAFFNGLKQR